MKGTVTNFDISDTLAVQRNMNDLVWQEKGLNKDLVFDRATNQVTNDKIANGLLVGPPPRKGWEQFYEL